MTYNAVRTALVADRVSRARVRRCVLSALLGSLLGCASTYSGARAPSTFDIAVEPAAATVPIALPGANHGGSTPIALGLPALIRISVLADPAITSAFEAVAQARADVITASLAPNPGLAISQTLMPLPGNEAEPQLDIEIGYSLDALLFGKRDAAIEVARHGVDVALAEHADLVRQRILEAITIYFEALQARELVTLAREEVEQLERLASITERRLTAGGIGQVELDRIELEVIGGRRRLVQAEAELDNATTWLRVHLGRAAGAERAEARGPLAITTPAPIDLAAAIAAAEQHRPDLVAARRKIAQAKADVHHQRVTARPELSVAAGYTKVVDVDMWGLGLEMSLPVLDRNQGNIARARSAVRQAEGELEAAGLAVRAQIALALRTYRLQHQIVTAIDPTALATAGTVRKRIEDAYALGGRTLVEVLDAQTSYRETYREHVTARAQLMTALHTVNAVVGTELLR